MKRLRQLCAVTVLTILLTNVASADEGVLHPGYMPTPTPTPMTGVLHPGIADSSELLTENEKPATDLQMEITLLLIQNMLALF